MKKAIEIIARELNVSPSTVRYTWISRYKEKLKEEGIIKIKPTGRKETIVDIDPDRFIEFIKNKRTFRPVKKPQVIGVANTKGGTGKTTLTNILATYFASEGYKVLIIDVDPQASQTLLLGVNPDLTINTNHDITRAWNNQPVSPVKITENLDLIPSNKSLAQIIESGKPFREMALERLIKGSRSIEGLLDKYDYIFIDPPATNGILMTASLIASDYIITPARLSFVDETGLRVFAQTLAETLENTGKEIELLGIVPMEFEKSALEHLFTIKSISGFVPSNMLEKVSPDKKEYLSGIDKGFYDELKALDGLILPDREKFILPYIPKRTAVPKAMSMGKSVWEYIEKIEPRLRNDELFTNMLLITDLIKEKTTTRR